MKRWWLLTLILYMICLSILMVPLFLAFAPADSDNKFISLFYFGFVPILVLIQGVLLLVPIDVIRERPIKRRKVVLSVVIGAIPMAALTLGFIASIAFMIWGEDVAGVYLYNWPCLIIPAISWIFWGIVFYRSFSSENPRSFISTVTNWLLRGSILELLVAIPSHIISRQRDDCCAPPFLLLGIATGLAIALMSFGPGVFFLQRSIEISYLFLFLLCQEFLTT